MKMDCRFNVFLFASSMLGASCFMVIKNRGINRLYIAPLLSVLVKIHTHNILSSKHDLQVIFVSSAGCCRRTTTGLKEFYAVTSQEYMWEMLALLLRLITVNYPYNCSLSKLSVSNCARESNPYFFSFPPICIAMDVILLHICCKSHMFSSSVALFFVFACFVLLSSNVSIVGG